MGLSIQDVGTTGSTMRKQTGNILNMIWVVIRREPIEEMQVVPAYAEWHLQGLSFDEQEAIAMCRDEHYFIGPLPVGVALPHDKVEWVGAYFPLKSRGTTSVESNNISPRESDS